MSDARAKRIAREIKDVLADKTSGITIEPVTPDNLMHLQGSFRGPEGTPYEGGHFFVDIQFITKVYHPNISSASGAICLDILKDAWTPVLTIRSTMVSLQSLLCSPEPKDPQDAEVAKHYLSDRAGFESTAKYWTDVYAKPQSERAAEKAPASGNASSATRKGADELDEAKVHGLDPAVVSNFVNMGFSRTDVIDVMRRLNYRGTNAAKVGEDAVVSALLGA